MSNFYDPFAKTRKKKLTKKFFDISQNDVQFEHENNMRKRTIYQNRIKNICKKYIQKLKERRKARSEFQESINQVHKQLQDLFTVIRLKPSIKDQNFISERFLAKFLSNFLQFFDFLQSTILTSLIKIKGQIYIQSFSCFLNYQSDLLKILSINFESINNNKKLNFQQFIDNSASKETRQYFKLFFENLQKTFSLSQNFYVHSNFQTMVQNLHMIENTLFLQQSDQNVKGKKFAKQFYGYYNNFYFNNNCITEIQKNTNIFIEKLLQILKIQENFPDKEKIAYTRYKIFEFIFKNPYYFECITTKKDIDIISIFGKEIIKTIKTDLTSQNVQKVQQNIILFIIIQYSQNLQELEIFISHNNLQYDLQNFILNKVKDFSYDSLYQYNNFSQYLIQNIINKEQICTCIKNNYFKSSNRIMMDIYSLFFYSLKKSSSNLILTNLLKFIIKDKEIINYLQKSILSAIAQNQDILEEKFNMILLEEILRLRLMIEEESEILQDFQNWEDFFKRFYEYLFRQVEFYQDLHYKNRHELYIFLFKCVSQILQFIMNLNDQKKFLHKLYQFDGTFDYDFIRDFYFFFDIEFRFNILRKSFGNIHNQMINVTINRNDILEQGIEIYQKMVDNNSMTGRERIQVTFVDETGNYEAGIDQGGLYKDFVGEFASRIFDPNLGYFIVLENGELYINPSVYQWVDFSPETIYKVMGLLIARCFQEGYTLNKILSRTFIRKIKGLPNYFKELKYYDKGLYNQLKNLKEIDNLEDLCLTFTVNEKDTNRIIELIPNGSNIIVNKQNLTRYLYVYADYKMNVQVQKQFNSFQEGFKKVFDRSLLKFFSEKEVQLLVNGTEESIDVKDWMENTKIFQRNHLENMALSQYAKQFWKTVEEFDQSQRKKLLKFVTNYERPPLFGFKNLHPQFQIDFNTQLNPDSLPTSSTCSNILHIPIYKDKEILKQKLLKAIELTKGHYNVIIMGYELETFKDFWYEMFCYQYPKTAFAMLVFWLIYLCIKVDCLVDFGWTFNHWIIGLTLVLQYLDEQNARTWISLGILTLWFIRLGGFLFVTRILTKFEDKRYKDMSGKSKNKALYFFFQYQLQALIVVFTATPLYFIFRRSDVLWRWTFFVGGALALIGIVGEGVADHQLNEYKKKKKKEKKKEDNGTDGEEMQEQNSNLIREKKKSDKYSDIFNEGLWRKSRHPNLFFELVTWIGFALMGLNDYTISWMAFLGPFLLWAVMYFLTIPISEKSMAKSRKNWDDFVKETNMFIPL